jgi:hypothetical protein
MGNVTGSGPLLSSAFNQIQRDLAALPPDAKAAVVLDASFGDDNEIGIGVAARLPDGWVLTGEATWWLYRHPRARVSIGKVWR